MYHVLIGDPACGSVEIINNVSRDEALRYALDALEDGTLIDEITIVKEVPIKHTQKLSYEGDEE